MKKGYKLSEETKEKIRQAHLGVKRPGIGGNKKGFKHSEKTKIKISEGNRGKILSEETKIKIGLSNKNNKTGIENGKSTRFKATGSKGVNILGKNGYRNLHKWLVKNLGKPTKCEHCGKENLTGKHIHWANKDHLYKKNLKDYIRLCVKCHWHYDRKYSEHIF